jgi:hypothetical protein
MYEQLDDELQEIMYIIQFKCVNKSISHEAIIST